MQIPRHLKIYDRATFDEFNCLNLNITAPRDAQPGSLPVVIWFHGGAQLVSFPAADERLGGMLTLAGVDTSLLTTFTDPGPLVAQSISSKKPFILVTFNHRLNILAYGDNNGPKNLQLQDCSTLCDWIRANIHDFGGNPNNIALAGESAGSVLAHASLVVNSKGIKRVILCSGTLYSAAPKPSNEIKPILDRVTKRGREIEAEKGNDNAPALTLRDMSIPTLIRAQAESYMSSVWLQEHPSLVGWEHHDKIFKDIDLMIGDVEFESILWLSPSKIFPEAALISCFTGTTKPNQPIPTANAKLAKAYLQNQTVTDKKLGTVKSGALDFVTDDHFAFPNYKISNYFRNRGMPVYQYIFEEVNPFVVASKRGVPRAHHAVDTLALFGGYEDDYPAHPSFKNFKNVSDEFRQSWINFVAGEAPWSVNKVYSFGPDGKVGELGPGEYEKKRRTEHFKVLEEVGSKVYDPVWTRIATTADIVIEKVQQMQKKQAAEAAQKRQGGAKI